MQHLTFVTKKGNGRKLLLTVFTWRFILNVTEPLDLTLKCIDKFILRLYAFNTPFTCSKSAQKTLEQCVKYIQN